MTDYVPTSENERRHWQQLCDSIGLQYLSYVQVIGVSETDNGDIACKHLGQEMVIGKMISLQANCFVADTFEAMPRLLEHVGRLDSQAKAGISAAEALAACIDLIKNGGVIKRHSQRGEMATKINRVMCKADSAITRMQSAKLIMEGK